MYGNAHRCTHGEIDFCIFEENKDGLFRGLYQNASQKTNTYKNCCVVFYIVEKMYIIPGGMRDLVQ